MTFKEKIENMKKIYLETNIKIQTGVFWKRIGYYPHVQEWILDTNKSQLNDYGMAAGGDKNLRFGRILTTYRAKAPNVYAKRTIKYKKSKGQPWTGVTLKDTGQFQNSFKLYVTPERYEVTAKFKKQGGLISDNLDTSKVLGLTPDNKDIFFKKIFKPEFIALIKYSIKNGK
jgi:hypothetical protein